MTTIATDAFGRLLIEQVRDPNIASWAGIVKRRAKGSVAGKPIEPILKALSDEQIEALVPMVTRIVDYTLHDLLYMIEENRWIKVRLEADGIIMPDLREAVGGGLEGYIFVWAEKFGTFAVSNQK